MVGKRSKVGGAGEVAVKGRDANPTDQKGGQRSVGNRVPKMVIGTSHGV